MVVRSTKAGAETPATRRVPVVHVLIDRRSTKAGAETPATRRDPREGYRTSTTLNEGRGRDPGDTIGFGLPDAHYTTLNEGRGRDPGDTPPPYDGADDPLAAQRRPGPRPRRHASAAMLSACILAAQRRPGPRPRRHACAALDPDGPLHRSTKAGAETPATHSVRRTRGPISGSAQRRPGPRPRRHC